MKSSREPTDYVYLPCVFMYKTVVD